MQMREDLPIMPLNTVLFPGAPASLYVHEERYRQMLARRLAEDGVFGVALLKSGKEVGGTGVPHDIGTLASITQVTRLPDDSSIVLARGGPRFRIDTITRLSPVVEADVALLEEDAELSPRDEAVVADARERMQALLALILRTLGEEDLEPPVPDDPVMLSYAAAAHVQASLAVQQQLLEAKSAVGRLEMALPMMRKEISYYRVMLAAKEQREQMGLGDEDEGAFSRN